uniref:Uncharacterized protein n=1 Tax=Neobodo designis TaxID=312471 RepID=A0A7S1R109_NEODS|mmetsp:Transcript_5863/g.18482  ORF Transcript_5863/g.18482 Transcript_5863/m.18482 type:complete len:478 (+) Transcript_5863:30-1463(+)
MSGVVLPASQRRLRHVEAICFRNLQAPALSHPKTGRRRGATTTNRLRRQTVVSESAPVVAVESIAATRFELFSMSGELLHRSEVHAPSKNPTFAPLSDNARQHVSPQLVVKVFAVEGHSESLLQSFSVDLRQVVLEARSLTALGRGRASTAEMSVLIKCDDGVFRSGGAAQRKDASENAGEPEAAADSAATEKAADDVDAWDFVDVDMVRDEERRMSQAPDTRSSVLLSLCAATASANQSIQVARQHLFHCRTCLEERHHVQTATRHAKNALQRADAAVRARKLSHLRQQLALRRQMNEKRRCDIEAATARLASDEATVMEASPCTPFISSIERRLAIGRRKQQIVRQIGELLEVSPGDGGGSILGHAISEDSTTEDTPTALGFVCLAIDAVSRISGIRLLYPVTVIGARSTVADGWHDDAGSIPLNGLTKADRTALLEGMRLLKVNIVSLAFALHAQKQAEGLPLGVTLQKLLVNS